MKPKYISRFIASLFVSASFSAFAQGNADSFLEPGKSYNIEYLLAPKTVSEAYLPRFVTVIKQGPQEWYYVKRCDGVNGNSLWVNFSEILSVREIDQKQLDILNPEKQQNPNGK